jgi:hypothetical protein
MFALADCEGLVCWDSMIPIEDKPVIYSAFNPTIMASTLFQLDLEH